MAACGDREGKGFVGEKKATDHGHRAVIAETVERDPGVMVIGGGLTMIAAEHGVGRAEAPIADAMMTGGRATANLIVVAAPETRPRLNDLPHQHHAPPLQLKAPTPSFAAQRHTHKETKRKFKIHKLRPHSCTVPNLKAKVPLMNPLDRSQKPQRVSPTHLSKTAGPKPR